ncbi:MAG TPA: aspartate kinase [Methanofastidiosum sp.]|jgi:aspartate kinase|nr:aspartate kinase [Methanofastidiosum sp.]
MRIVMKYGGTSVSNAERFLNTANIAIDTYNKKNEVIVIVSAMSGVTDMLLGAADISLKGGDIAPILNELRLKHFDACKYIKNEELLKLTKEGIDTLLVDLEKSLIGVHYLGELSLRSKDRIVSFGERLSSLILSKTIEAQGVASDKIDAFSLIVTDSNFGEASVLFNESYKKISETLLPLLKKGTIPVVTGFIAKSKDGDITTLGRGGSDYTASIVGAGIAASEIWIMTDVDGIMTTNPKICSNAYRIPEMSYLEAMELAYFGAKVLHPKTIEPAISKNIPVRVKNSMIDSPGTLILKDTHTNHKVVKAISIIENTAIVYVSGAGMIGVPGVAAKVFKALGDYNINVYMISQGSSEANISFAISENDIEKSEKALKEAFPTKELVKDISHIKGVNIISVVGKGMKGAVGTAAKLFTAIAKENVNILMISQGSSEVSISFVVSKEDGYKSIKAIHKAYLE